MAELSADTGPREGSNLRRTNRSLAYRSKNAVSLDGAKAGDSCFAATVWICSQTTKGRFGYIAGVFPYRVEELAEEGTLRIEVPNDFRAVILGHLMAHEIGHLLLGSESHSSKGIMRARWQREDLEAAVQGKLGFTPEQREKMREKIQDRGHAELSAAMDQ